MIGSIDSFVLGPDARARRPRGTRRRASATKKRPGFLAGAGGRTAAALEQIPQELVVDLVVKLDFLRLNERSQERAGSGRRRLVSGRRSGL